MFLFRNDGSLNAADFLASDDDDGLPAGDFFNSVINTGDEIGVLPAGSYIIAVGDYELSLAEAVAGINDSDSGGSLTGDRSEERRVGKEGVSTCRSRCARYT